MDNKPLKIFRQGAIAASVWQRTSKNGLFYEYTLSRSYLRGEDSCYSQCYRGYNEVAMTQVIRDASAYIRGVEAEASNTNDDDSYVNAA